MMKACFLLFLAALVEFALALTHIIERSRRGGAPKVTYGIFMSALPKFLNELDAQVQTWAATPLAEGRLIVVGDHDFHRPPASTFVATDCSAVADDVACKMAYLMLEAAHRKSDWLVVAQTDMYVNTGMVDALLALQDHTVPMAVGASYGCGCAAPRAGCDEVFNGGGFCGSSLYAISGPAIQNMIGDSDTSLIDRMKDFAGQGIPEDMANSCVLHQAHVPMYLLNDDLNRFAQFEEWEIGDMMALKRVFKDDLYMVHPVNPEMLHWIQANLTIAHQGLQLNATRGPAQKAVTLAGTRIDAGMTPGRKCPEE